MNAERFWSHVDRSAGLFECWPWLAFKSADGYGRFGVDGTPVNAHRVAYRLMVGPIPDGLTIDHLCFNRACVNPAHLEAVTNRVNVLRGNGPSARAARVTHCPQGHEYPAGIRTCATCRRRQSEGRRKCPGCGKRDLRPALWARHQLAESQPRLSEAQTDGR